MANVNWTKLRQSLIGDRNGSVLPPNIPLPMLPQVVMEFSRKAEDPDAGPCELGRIIESDGGLTCELLRYVNSAKFGLKVKASSAQQAIATLGIRASKLFLLTTGVQQAMKAHKSKLINIPLFWLANLERALFARETARLLRANGDVAFAGSMLHDFLLPLLSNEKYDAYVKYTMIEQAERPNLVDFERKAFGWDHSLAAAQVLLSWSFPDDLVCCVLLHHGGLKMLQDQELGKTAVAAVAVAALIPDVLYQSRAGVEQLVELAGVWPEFQLEEMAQRVAQQMAEMTPLAGQHFSLERRCEKLLHAAVEA
ncbi:MAG: HDOD domain-containing protein [Planctomycetaceae bacterium]